MQTKNNTISEYPMPSSLDVEYQVIGDFIGTPDVRNDVLKIVSPQMFSDINCQKIWLILVDRHTRGETIDMISIYPLCDKRFFTDNIIALCGYNGSVTTIDHALALQDIFKKREIYKASMSMLEGVVSGIPADEILSIPKELEKTIENSTNTNDMVSMSDSLREVSDELNSGEIKTIRCGIPTIDNLCNNGFGAGHLVILGGRPGSGKTSLSLDFAMRAARNGYKVCYFTIEMTNKELAKKMMVATGEVTMFDFIRKEKDWDRIERALKFAETSNLYISKKCSNITQILNKITTMHQEGKCDIAFVDYIQIVQSIGKDLREKIMYTTNNLKALARDLEIPIVATSQLNRNSKNENRRPIATDLKESGSIEQDADYIILLDVPAGEEGKNRVDAYLEKNRHGATSPTPIRLQGTNGFANFYELTDNYEQY